MEAEQETIDQVSDSEIFEEAIAPEAEAPKDEDRPRDEKGRFAAKEQAEAEAAVETPAVEAAPEPEKKDDHRIPLSELLNEREKRQREQQRADAFERQMEELRQQIAAQHQQPQPAPDQFQDPEGYNAYWRRQLEQQAATFQEQQRRLEANMSLRLARTAHKDVFDKAYDALLAEAQNGNRVPAQMVWSSPDPGEALVNWFQRENVLKQVGTDPEAYRTKLADELLNDPTWIAKAMEKAKATAGTQPTQVKLPPSLNKATAAGRADDTEDASDGGMYRYATQR